MIGSGGGTSLLLRLRLEVDAQEERDLGALAPDDTGLALIPELPILPLHLTIDALDLSFDASQFREQGVRIDERVDATLGELRLQGDEPLQADVQEQDPSFALVIGHRLDVDLAEVPLDTHFFERRHELRYLLEHVLRHLPPPIRNLGTQKDYISIALINKSVKYWWKRR